MSNLLKGLAAIKANQEAQKEREKARKEAQDRPKANWFKWPENVDVCKATFLKEFDENSPGYKPEQNGTATIAVEHEAPGAKGYLRRALCTTETEGACYASERHLLDPKEGWRPRQNLYIDALVDFGDGEKKHLLIQRNANSSFTHALIDEAVEEGSVTNNTFKITRSGSGTGTQWLLKRLKDEPFDTSGVTPYDLDQVAVRSVPYDKQAAYYGAVYGESTSDTDNAPEPQHSSDEDW